jgi:integrase/recombinase XerC
MTQLDVFRPQTALERSESWTKLNDEDMRIRAARAIGGRDVDELWSVTEAYLIQKGKSGTKVSRKTLSTYRRGVLDLLDAWQGENLLRPGRRAGQQWIRQLETKLGAKSVPVKLAAARTFYKALRWADVTEVDPFADVTVRQDKTNAWEKRQPYSQEELVQLIKEVDTMEKVIVLLGSHAGLRVSEMAKLEWADLNRMNGKITVKDGKGGKQRTVKASKSLLTAVGAWELENTDLEAETVLGIKSRMISYVLEGLCARAGVPFRGVHALRHSAGTNLYEQTNDLGLVADHLGHASIDTTRIYAKIADKRLDRTVGEW